MTAQTTNIAAIQSTNPPENTHDATWGPDGRVTVGWYFTVGANNIRIKTIGIYDSGNDGLSESHEAGIWTETGTLLSSTTIPSGITGTLVSGYRYQSITPVDLIAGQVYVVAVQFVGHSGDNNLTHGVQSYASQITYNGLRQTGIDYSDSDPFTFPSVWILPGQQPTIGANFQFDVLLEKFVGPGTSFLDPTNWESGSVPSANQDIIIAANQTMVVDDDYTCGTLKFENGASFNCTNGKKLTITGNVLDKNGDVAIEVSSSLIVSSSITINN